MVTTAEKDAIQEQTIKLCQTLLDQPEFAENTAKIERFLSDDASKGLYIKVTERGQELHQKQQQGVQIPESDASEFGEMRDSMMNNPVISDFMVAQESLNGIHQTISGYVAKTLELGRIPAEEDLQSSGCCGGGGDSGGCGC